MNYLSSLNLNLKFNEPLKNYTTFGIGGNARLLAKPKNINELKKLIKISLEKKERFFILGCGSNLLVRDEGFDGTVINLNQGEFLRLEKINNIVEAGAGVRIASLLGWCRKHGFSGLEFMAGIPASVGGAVKQNAGSSSRTIAQALAGITYLDKNLELKKIPAEELKFSYRHLELDLTVIVSAAFKFNKSTPAEVMEKIHSFFDLKNQKQPLREKSAGCVFKNPAAFSAGVLIEEAGFKGRRLGGAKVSEKHANFIINKDNAVCRDVLSLIELIKKEIKLKKNILLEEEINILS